MSYRVWLIIDTGGSQPHNVVEELSITINLKPMMLQAGLDLPSLDGLIAGDCVMKVTEAVRQLGIEPDRFDAVAPADWHNGCYLDLSEFAEKLLQDLLAHPKTTVQVSW